MKSDIGTRKIAEANKHLNAAQKERDTQEKASRAESRRVQTTKQSIAGGLRGPLQHQTSFQKDLMASPDYVVPKKLRKVKPAVCTK